MNRLRALSGFGVKGPGSFCHWGVHPRLSGIRTLLQAVRPGLAMAAYLETGSVHRLVAALSTETLVFASEFVR